MASLLNQMQTWLVLPKLWRFVGFASALLGLLCFALSSSLNSLFGEWNLLKAFLYVIFCFIICTAVLFANVWQQHSSSHRSEAHSAFLVLTITSFSTFFLDKAATGKPDAYSLVSWASFAVMSLSLSRQIHLGFEGDLLSFFLGDLIVQLMKIKWLFGIAGAVFSYFLVILSSCLDVSPEVEEDTHTELQDLPHVVIEVDSLQLPSNATANNNSRERRDSEEESAKGVSTSNGGAHGVVRGEDISERMKNLQDLVPGCNKVIGKAVVLDETINYMQSLQRQVEFLSMKLGTVNSRLNSGIEAFPPKDFGQQTYVPAGMPFGSQATREYSRGSSPGWLHMQVGGAFENEQHRL